MSINSLRIFDETHHKTNIWLKDLMEEMDSDDRQRAYRVLRAVLHVLRDRLTVDEAAKLGAQLPMLVRGFYYEGWHPAGTPVKMRHRDEFLGHVRERLRDAPDMDVERATRAVFAVIARHVTGGEVDAIIHSMPKEVRRMWPSTASAR
jgi:uncharacterized protein (DUF2267 family)